MTEAPEQILVFADETYPDRTDGDRIRFTALAVSRSQLKRRLATIAKLKGLRKSRQIKELSGFLGDDDFLISVCEINRSTVFGNALFQNRDSYRDVGSICRTDKLWVHAFGSSVTSLIAVINERWALHPIRVYYDERSLREELQDMFEASIKSRLQALAAEDRRQLSLGGELVITAVQQVSKPKTGEPQGLEHDGIWLVDTLGRALKHLLPDMLSRPNFVFRNQTRVPVRLRELEVAAAPLAEDPRVLAIYGFGSHARGEAGPGSDLDLAVLMDEDVDLMEELRLRGDLVERMRRDDIDLVILNHASPLLRYEVISAGQRLFSRDDERVDAFEHRAAMHCFDTAYLRATQQRLIREARR